MTISLQNLNDFYHKIYLEPCQEFEEVREMCLAEDNWLRDLYTPNNLKIENHFGYSVVFHKETNLPVGMAGVFNDGRYPPNVARHLHREYLFPKFRQKTRQGIKDIITLHREHLLKPLIKINKFEVYILAIQNREKKSTKGYWDIFSKIAVEVNPEWNIGKGYIQTCPFNVQKCWQNFLYTEITSGAYASWDKKMISHDEWLKLEAGV